MKTNRLVSGLLLLTGLAAQAQFTYVTNSGIAIIVGYTGPSGAVTIPSSLGGLPVTVIQGNGFEDKGVTSVAIPDTVTNIETQEFAPNDSLTSFTVDSNNPVFSSSGGLLLNKAGTTIFEFPSGISGAYSVPTNITAVGQNAFAACYYLTSVTIPNSVTNIGSEGFGFCFDLTNFTIPASVRGLGSDAFINCESLAAITVDPANPAYKSVGGVLFDKSGSTLLEYPTALQGSYSIPDGVTTIGTNAFILCDGLSGVTMPSSVATISDGAFADCGGLTNVTLGSGVSDLIYSAFAGCGNLQAINVDPANTNLSSINGVVLNKSQTTIIKFPPGYSGAYTTPASVTSVAAYAFEDCDLTDLAISSNVNNIGMLAFQGCGSLTNVTIEGPVASIGDFTFADSPKLATVTISATVADLAYGAFAYDGLTSVTFLGNAPTTDQAFLGDDSATIYYQPGTSGWGSTFEGLTTALENAPVPNGALQITLLPVGVGAAGAQWQVDGGFLQPSGAIVLGLSVGSHTVSFTSVPGWMAPSNIAVSVSANATNSTSGTYIEEAAPPSDFTFVTNAGTITITGYVGQGGGVEIPSLINGRAVTAIGQSAFANNGLITSVVIPDSVTNLGDFAFSACYGLEDVTISQGLTQIGLAMFQDCAKLTNVDLRGVLTSLGDDAFASCQSLDYIPIQDTVTNIGQYEFFGDAITNVSIPAGVLSVGEAAFNNCTALSAISVDPANTSYSGAGGVLFNKDQTVLVQYPDGKPGTSYVISNSVTTIADTAFEYCSLTNVTIPASVTSIGNYSFEFCASLTGLVFPDTLASLGANSFAFCYSLTGITLPASLVNLGPVPFVDCTNMTAITVDPANPVFESVSGVVYNKSGADLIEFPGGLGGNFAVPATVQDIGSQSFENSLITGVTIPASVTNIEDYAFSGCGVLGSAVMANNVKSIGVAAFDNAYFLTNLVLSTTLTNIGSFAFSDCGSLTTVVIPPTVSVLGDYAFAYSPLLASAYFEGNAPPDDSTVFANDSATTIYYWTGTAGWTAAFGAAPTVPLAEITKVNVSASTVVLDAISGQSNRTYIVLSTTNLALPLSQWTPVATNLLAAPGNFTTTILNLPDASNRFFTLQTH